MCINAFSFPFKKKCRLTWFQILARSLIAEQLLHFSEPLKSAKGRTIIIATLQGCCGGLNKTWKAQGSPPRVAPSKCVGLVDHSHGTTYTKVDCSGGHQRSSDHVFRAPAIPSNWEKPGKASWQRQHLRRALRTRSSINRDYWG